VNIEIREHNKVGMDEEIEKKLLMTVAPNGCFNRAKD
jgi:cephalosporin hydroxylase